MTLALLWEEHRAAAPDESRYSWFCDLYREWAGLLKPTLRQVHLAGEHLFVDFAGSKMAVAEGADGEERYAAIFVAVLGASSFTFAYATWSQGLPDWIGAHVRAFGYFDGVARQLVSDNLKAGVTRPCFHEPAAGDSAAIGTRTDGAAGRMRDAGGLLLRHCRLLEHGLGPASHCQQPDGTCQVSRLARTWLRLAS